MKQNGHRQQVTFTSKRAGRRSERGDQRPDAPVTNAAPAPEPTSYSLAILRALRPGFTGINGDHKTKSTTKRLTARRARNKVARASRRANRSR